MPSKTIPISIAAAALIAANALAQSTADLRIRPDERWWAGIIAEADGMPFMAASQYEFDFYANTAGNQGQPLLISDKGRFLWCDEPFSFRIADGQIHAVSKSAPIVSGEAGKALREAYLHVSRQFFPTAGKIPHEFLFLHPQYNTWIELTYNQNQKDVLKYARAVGANGFPRGVLMIDEGWFSHYGHLDFDRARFPDAKAMMAELHSLGFPVMLWVCPYITPDGQFFTELWLDHTKRKKTVWFVNADNPRQPALTEWWDGFSALVDLTNPTGRAWFKSQLDGLVKDYGVDGFKFDGGDAAYYDRKAMLTPARAYEPKVTPNGHTEAYARLGLDFPLNEYRATWKMGGQPLAQRLRDKNHDWADLRKLIPGILAQGLMGYAFTCPDLIGGGDYLSFRDRTKLDEELVVRAAQLHALMPMMQFSAAPWRVLSPHHLEIARHAAQLHDQLGPEILALAKRAAATGEPIVRTLEYAYPNLGYGAITDQFLLGETILVAPVLTKGGAERTVVFPPGTWKGDDGSVTKGPAKQVVKAPLERLPWWRLQT
jgi:alpha-glucosidase (family GH31 glycosyl hydrolase)